MQIGDAFVADQFDARTLDVGRKLPDATKKVSSGLVRFVNTMLPRLTPDQRTKLATMIREHRT